MKRVFCLFFCLLFLSGCAAKPQPPEYDKPVIALLDTGVSTTAIDSGSLLPGHNYVTDTDDTEDRLDHGTAVASVILGCESAEVTGLAAGKCLVLPLVVADEGGSISPQTLALAIREAVDIYGADVINVSLGIKKDEQALREAVAYAEKQGVVVISAVGNDGGADLFYPAAYETVIAVGSHDRSDQVSDFSQKNGTVDLLAPGEDVWFANKDGRTYGSWGTSYAAGYVSAAAALLLAEEPSLKPEQLRQRLFDAAEDILAEGRDSESGWGILRLQP